ncbi:MAG: alpha/beta fold hydrolase [Oscillospiraceae bacterium]|nr:alpha/beta fold hydrolase [Oscillospiraceae bacterium]MDD4367389.1 alpha/beta fold hydrolase [Oscillospiraceae bacterium]
MNALSQAAYLLIIALKGEAVREHLELLSGDHQLIGELYRPQTQGPCPCLILGHGLTGNRNERLLVTISQTLYDIGISSLRFDFNGHGESSGAAQNVTLRSETADLAAVLAFAKAHPGLDSAQLFVSGHSMGSLVALMTYAQQPQAIAGLVLISSAFTIFHELTAPLTGSNLTSFLSKGVMDLGGFQIGRELIEDCAALDGFALARQVTPHALLIHGQNDQDSPPYNSVQLKYIWKEHAQLKLIPGADHCYTNTDANLQVCQEISHYMERCIAAE